MTHERHRRYARRWGDVTTIGAGLVVLVPSTLVAETGEVPDLERDVFFAINGLPDFLTVVFFPLQLLGVLVVPLLVAAVALVWRREWRLALALAVLVPLKLIVEKQVLKALVDRERPAAAICDGDLTCAEFRNVPLAFDSFPSGHAVIVGAMVVLLLPYVGRRVGIGLIVVTALVGIARIYLGAHNPLDVVGGVAAGAVIGAVLNLIVGVPRAPDPRT